VTNSHRLKIRVKLAGDRVFVISSLPIAKKVEMLLGAADNLAVLKPYRKGPAIVLGHPELAPGKSLSDTVKSDCREIGQQFATVGKGYQIEFTHSIKPDPTANARLFELVQLLETLGEEE
jgi:hypothetical protein